MFYHKIALAIGVCVLVSNVFGDRRSEWNAEFKEAIKHTFANDKTLDVDNVSGSIRVIGDGGNTIRVEGEKVIKALNQAELDRAKREVVLDINEKDSVAQLYVNGPFRGRNSQSDSHGFHDHSDHEYEVNYNFVIHVPRETMLQLRNVNGATSAEETRGKFDLHDVNGAITLTNISGYGKVNTVNGALMASFREAPKQPTEFKTVNGKIEASFPPNFAADVSLKTMNGSVYTDFDSFPATPAPPATPEKKDGRYVYRSNRTKMVRIGSGGPEVSFETLNGSITIKKGSAQ
jgi:hypothetical protein